MGVYNFKKQIFRAFSTRYFLAEVIPKSNQVDLKNLNEYLVLL